MRFGFPNLHVRSMDESVKFYKELLGLKVKGEMSPTPEMKIVFLEDENGQKIELIEDKNSNFNYEKDHKIGFVFLVDDIFKAKSEVESKGFILDGPLVEIQSGVKFFYVIDPNGVPIQLTHIPN